MTIEGERRPTKHEIEVTLATTWRKWGGWPAVESGMVNMTGVMAQAVMDLYASASQAKEQGK